MFDFYPGKLWSRNEVMDFPNPVPALSGVYFWWFKTIPSYVPTDGCIKINGHTLLYVGISPDKKLTLVSSGLMNGWKKMPGFTGYLILSHGFSRKY